MTERLLSDFFCHRSICLSHCFFRARVVFSRARIRFSRTRAHVRTLLSRVFCLHCLHRDAERRDEDALG